MKNFRFSPAAVQHIYQRAIDRGVIFYTLEDRMVYYTLASVKSRRHNIRVVAASLMFTHLHQSVIAPSMDILRSYIHDTNTSFTRLYNSRYHREGRLFEKPPGRSQKTSSKEQRTNLAYVFNNHVEKKICRRAEDERWSLLAYSRNANPFSDPDTTKLSPSLLKAMRLVDRRVKKGTPLEYVDLDKIRNALDCKEYEQFIDYSISRFKLIDYSYGENLFGNHTNMITAIDSMTGSEFDIREDYTSKPDTAYIELVNMSFETDCLHEIYSPESAKKEDLVRDALNLSSASLHQIIAFFHLDAGAKDQYGQQAFRSVSPGEAWRI